MCMARVAAFRWRPLISILMPVRDPDPRHLELAVASRARYIVTYNGKDFAAAASFGIEALTPESFLRIAGV